MNRTIPNPTSKTPLLRTMKFRQQLFMPFIILLFTLLACNIGRQDTSSGSRITNLLPTLTATVVANFSAGSETDEPVSGEVSTPPLSPADPNSTPLPLPIEANIPTESETGTSAAESNSGLSPTPIDAAGSDDSSASVEQPIANAVTPTPIQTIDAAFETLPTSTPTPTLGPVATFTATPLPAATASPLPAATAPPLPNWSYTGLRTYYSKSGKNLSMYGAVVNNTGTSQKLKVLTASFYDDQGQLIDEDSYLTVNYWPSNLIPAGERLPFKLTALNIENMADFELNVDTQPLDLTSQDFEILDVSEGTKFGQPCLQGRLSNVGGALQEVVIVGTLYNDQDQLLQFGEYKQLVAGRDLAAQPLNFEICFNINNPNLITRHELRAWGQ